MTRLEYSNSGYENRHALFIFSNGVDVSGVISNFFLNEPDNYYLVESPKMVEFKRYMDEGNQEKMKSLCRLVNLNDIVEIEPIEPITFTIRANVAFQRLHPQTQREMFDTLQTLLAQANFLDQQRKVYLQEKLRYIVRINHWVRVLIQKTRRGLIVSDIFFHRRKKK